MKLMWNVSHKWRRVCSVCHNHNSVISSFKAYHRVCYKSNTKSATCGAGAACRSGAPECIPTYVARSLVFFAVFCRSSLVLFLLTIVLSVLRFAASVYPFGIFQLFLSFKKYNITVSMISKIMEEILRNYKKHIIKASTFGFYVRFIRQIVCGNVEKSPRRLIYISTRAIISTRTNIFYT